jgi:hypothetical protein
MPPIPLPAARHPKIEGTNPGRATAEAAPVKPYREGQFASEWRNNRITIGAERSSCTLAFVIQGCEFFVRKDDVSSSDVLLEMRHL